MQIGGPFLPIKKIKIKIKTKNKIKMKIKKMKKNVIQKKIPQKNLENSNVFPFYASQNQPLLKDRRFIVKNF